MCTRVRLAAMKETLEREIKLAPEEGFVLPELGGRRMPTRVFISTYHDTADLRLARHGITFRHRVEDGAGVWQLKLPRDAARLELEVGGPPARPPAELLDLLPAYLRGAPLVPVARLRTRREVVLAQGAEIVDDSVAVLEGQRVSRRFREVEVELIDGDEKALAPARQGAAQGRRPRDRGAPAEALPRARPERRTDRPEAHEGHAARRGARDRARGRLPRAARPRPRHPPRRRSREPASAPRRDPAAAGISPRGAPARRSRMGRVAPRGARLARRPSRAGARPRRDARPAARRGGGARRRRRGGGRPARGARGRPR